MSPHTELCILDDAHDEKVSRMLWWFEREGRKVRMEVLQLSTGDYELRMIGVDGVEHVEHFTDAAELAKRQLEIQGELLSKGWSPSSRWIV